MASATRARSYELGRAYPIDVLDTLEVPKHAIINLWARKCRPNLYVYCNNLTKDSKCLEVFGLRLSEDPSQWPASLDKVGFDPCTRRVLQNERDQDEIQLKVAVVAYSYLDALKEVRKSEQKQ